MSIRCLTIESISESTPKLIGPNQTKPYLYAVQPMQPSYCLGSVPSILYVMWSCFGCIVSKLGLTTFILPKCSKKQRRRRRNIAAGANLAICRNDVHIVRKRPGWRELFSWNRNIFRENDSILEGIFNPTSHRNAWRCIREWKVYQVSDPIRRK